MLFIGINTGPVSKALCYDPLCSQRTSKAEAVQRSNLPYQNLPAGSASRMRTARDWVFPPGYYGDSVADISSCCIGGTAADSELVPAGAVVDQHWVLAEIQGGKECCPEPDCGESFRRLAEYSGYTL